MQVDAGRFGPWLDELLAAAGGQEVDVPCGTCTACCTSSQFVHVEPDEADALAAIPADLLVAAPGLPPGHRLMGFDGSGRCPMLGRSGCSIYERRPRTCRTYDCRVLAAAGLEVGDPAQRAIDDRVRSWRFRHDAGADGELQVAVRAAAEHLRARAGDLPPGALPRHPTQLAFLAASLHHLFLAGATPSDGALLAAVEAVRRGAPPARRGRRP